MRNAVVAAYKQAGLGGERYGVVCPKCKKRIAPQGYWVAMENPKEYCTEIDQYGDEHEDIISILETHGLGYRELKVRTKMREATVKKSGKKKKKAKEVREPERVAVQPGYPSFLEELAARRRRENAR